MLRSRQQCIMDLQERIVSLETGAQLTTSDVHFFDSLRNDLVTHEQNDARSMKEIQATDRGRPGAQSFIDIARKRQVGGLTQSEEYKARQARLAALEPAPVPHKTPPHGDPLTDQFNSVSRGD